MLATMNPFTTNNHNHNHNHNHNINNNLPPPHPASLLPVVIPPPPPPPSASASPYLMYHQQLPYPPPLYGYPPAAWDYYAPPPPQQQQQQYSLPISPSQTVIQERNNVINSGSSSSNNNGSVVITVTNGSQSPQRTPSTPKSRDPSSSQVNTSDNSSSSNNGGSADSLDNWHEMLLTPDHIKNIKKPLSPPKRRENDTYASLQDFLLTPATIPAASAPVSTSTTATAVTGISTSSKQSHNGGSTSPPRSSSSSPEKRWAGPAFCNSPSPNSLPLPSLDLFEGSSNDVVQANRPPQPQIFDKQRSMSLPVLTGFQGEDTKKQHFHNTKTDQNPKRNLPKKANSFKGQSREEVHQPSPTKKRSSYVPKHKASDRKSLNMESSPVVQDTPQQDKQLEQLSNELRLMLNLKAN